MIVLHHLNNSRSQRVLWLLEELGLPYEIKRYERDATTNLAPPELLTVHPLGKSPVIVDGGLTIAESGAIVEYLADKYGAGRFAQPPGSPERLRYTYWMHFAEGTAMPPLLLKLIFDRLKTAAPFLIRPIARAIADRVLGLYVLPNLERNLNFMEAELGKHEWFVGNTFGAADVQLSFPLEAARMRAGLNESRPKLLAFLKKIHARPAYQKALERGGRYDFLDKD